MGGRVLLQDLILGVSRRADISEEEAGQFVRTVFSVLADSLGEEKLVKIRNLGTFKLVEIDERETTDPATGEIVRIKGYKKVVFSPDNSLKDLINRPFAQFESVVINEQTDIQEMERGADTPDEMHAENDDMYSEDDSDFTSDESSDEGGDEDGKDQETDRMGDDVSDENSVQSDSFHDGNLNADVQSACETKMQVEMPETTDEVCVSSCADTESHRQDELPLNELSDSRSEDTPNAHIEHQHAEFQKVQEQRVEELKVSTQTVEHQTIAHQSIVQQTDGAPEAKGAFLRITQSGMVGLFLFILLLMTGSYLVGYYRILSPGDFFDKESEKSVSTEKLPSGKATLFNDTVKAVQRVKNESIQKQDSSVSDSLVSGSSMHGNKQEYSKPAAEKLISEDTEKKKEIKTDPKVSLREQASKYPQLKGGKYLIVGIKETLILKSGETLLRLAQKYYGSKNFVQYIIVLNGIENPDLIQIGAEIKIPELAKSTDIL